MEHDFSAFCFSTDNPHRISPPGNHGHLCGEVIRLSEHPDNQTHYYPIGNSDLPISEDATGCNTSMIADCVEKMAIGHGSSPPSVRLSLAGLPET
jgi:hypothetical protein